jgi:hypothetical protein
MGRSPIRSRIVNAVPMKTAAIDSSVRICAASSGVSLVGSATPNPA